MSRDGGATWTTVPTLRLPAGPLTKWTAALDASGIPHVVVSGWEGAPHLPRGWIAHTEFGCDGWAPLQRLDSAASLREIALVPPRDGRLAVIASMEERERSAVAMYRVVRFTLGARTHSFPKGGRPCAQGGVQGR